MPNLFNETTKFCHDCKHYWHKGSNVLIDGKIQKGFLCMEFWTWYAVNQAEDCKKFKKKKK